MPPISPQGSRGGLITAVVIFVIGFVTATIFAIFYGVQNNKTEALNKQLEDKSRKLVRDPTTPTYLFFEKYVQSHPNLPEPTIVGGMSQMLSDINSKLVGSGDSTVTADPSVGLQRAQDAVAEAGKANGINDLPDNLVQAIARLSDYSASLKKQLHDAQEHQNAFTNDTVADIKGTTERMQGLQKQVDDLTKKLQDVETEKDKLHDEYVAQTNKDHEAMDSERRKYNETLNDAKTQQADLMQNMQAFKKERDQAVFRIGTLRAHPEDVMTAQADGSIISVAPDDVVYINLHQGDHVTIGMPFEVYSQKDGIPKLGNGLSIDDMPRGVGSIEVQRIGPDTCECRITRVENGRHINPGDLIANVVYNRNLKYNFFVFGKFDLSQLNRPSDPDREYIQGLIVRWGGKLSPELSVDTDFVVMGSEPKVSDYSQENMTDPFTAKRKANEESAVKAYQDVLDKAKDLHIPVMNQTRFLIYCGYYDRSLQ